MSLEPPSARDEETFSPAAPTPPGPVGSPRDAGRREGPPCRRTPRERGDGCVPSRGAARFPPARVSVGAPGDSPPPSSRPPAPPPGNQRGSRGRGRTQSRRQPRPPRRSAGKGFGSLGFPACYPRASRGLRRPSQVDRDEDPFRRPAPVAETAPSERDSAAVLQSRRLGAKLPQAGRAPRIAPPRPLPHHGPGPAGSHRPSVAHRHHVSPPVPELPGVPNLEAREPGAGHRLNPW